MLNKLNNSLFPYLGFGLGLRSEHYETILEELPKVDWFEILTENYLVPNGKPLQILDKIRQHYPVVMHGVSLSIGGSDPIDMNYLQQVKQLAEYIEPKWISDHLCWTGVDGVNLHDLLPLPYNQQTIDHVVSRINQVQEFLGRRILLENVSSYLTYTQSEIPEWEFLDIISRQADCYILLDVNNIYVSAYNQCFDPQEYLKGIPVDRVGQIHLAGHSNKGNYILDTHDDEIIESVWKLYCDAIQRFGLVSTMIERDDNIPNLNVLLKEMNYARSLAEITFKELLAVNRSS